MSFMNKSRKILSLMSTGYEYSEWQEAKVAYMESLSDVTRSSEIEDALDIDEKYTMPVDLMIATYRKLLSLKRDPATLREFAYYLLAHGPDWDEEAENMLSEAKKAESGNQ